MADYIKSKVEEGVNLLTIDNPPVNVLSPDVIRALDSALDQAIQDDATKVIVITGAGANAFVAGADVKVIANIKSASEAEELALQGQGVFNKIENSDKPVIAAINGVCLGGGNELILACHMRIASDRARFGQPEINLGIIPGFGGTQRLMRLCGKALATELVLTGDVLSAQEALRIGLVNKVILEDQMLRQAVHLGKKIATKGQIAVKLCLEAFRAGSDTKLSDALKLEASLFGKSVATEDRVEGVAAFLEKRQPKFKNK